MQKSNTLLKRVAMLLVLVGPIVSLTACSDLASVQNTLLRDRTYDYARYPVSASKPLVLPHDLTIDYQPHNVLPKGNNHYTPVAFVDIAPPHIDQPLYIVGAGRAYEMRQHALKQQLDNLQKELVLVKQQATHQSAPSANNTHTQSQTQTSVTNKTHAHATQPAQTQPLSVLMTKDTDHVPVLQIKAPFQRAWKRIGAAIPKLGYQVVRTDPALGYYFIAPRGHVTASETVLLYLRHLPNQVDVMIYDASGNLSKNAQARHIIGQLANSVSQ